MADAECLQHYDKRKMFLDALYEALDDKPLDKVKPNELCERCGASRSTFYRYFGSVTDIPMWYRNYGAQIGMYQIGRRFTVREGHLVSVQLLAQYAKLYHYYAGSPRTHNLEFAYTASQSHIAAMREVMAERGYTCDEKCAYEIETIAFAACIVVSSWIKNGMDLPVADVVEVLCGLYPTHLRTFFDTPPKPASSIDVVRGLLESR